jgi:hypothetical protein
LSGFLKFANILESAMSNDKEMSQPEFSQTSAQDRQPWQKPEAKVADVSTATLAGNHATNPADLGTCAS